MRTEGHDLRHHGDAEVRDAGSAVVDLAVTVRAAPRRVAAGADRRVADLSARIRTGGRRGRRWPRDTGCRWSGYSLTAGAAEAFVLLARALKVRRPVVVHPQFTEPEAALRDAGHPVDRVLLREEDGFRLDPAAVRRTPTWW
ncbi:Aminotransferase OS=Streptomyces alboniger OX=132473 GN=CP975_07835 PE=3 SV=1 [Streptomyces alboniger]